MQQITPSIYKCEAGENVTLEVEATKVGYFTTFVVDGKMIENVPGSDPLTYAPFTVTVGPGLTHFGRVDAYFPPSAPDDAQYQFFLTGDTCLRPERRISTQKLREQIEVMEKIEDHLT